ncbi:hypothetical protein ACFVH6_18175 [Spirillospora sp. NPDC127200]
MIPSRVVPVCLALLALSAAVDAWLLLRLGDTAGELRIVHWRADRLGQAGIAGKLLAALVLAVLLRPLRGERPAAAVIAGLAGVTLGMAVLAVASVGALVVWAGVSRRG